MKELSSLADAYFDLPLALTTLNVTAPVELAFTTLDSEFLTRGKASITAHKLTTIYSLRRAITKPSLGPQGAGIGICCAEIR